MSDISIFSLNDLKVHYHYQNLDPTEELLADLQLLRQDIQAQFDLKKIILNSIRAEFMAEISSSVASKKWLTEPVLPLTMKLFLRARNE